MCFYFQDDSGCKRHASSQTVQEFQCRRTFDKFELEQCNIWSAGA